MKASIEENFIFTQQSLRTFKDCPLKFRKKYIENIRWSNSYDAKSVKRIENGKNFHILAYRYFSSINDSEEFLKNEDPILLHWLSRLKESFPLNSKVIYLPEYKAYTSDSNLRLEATFDLLSFQSDRVEIWDWKTHEAKHFAGKKTNQYSDSLQTKVYLFILKECMDYIYHGFAGSISMNYWQPEIPHILGKIDYNDTMHKEFGEQLKEMACQIKEYKYSELDRAEKKHCSVCEFNMLCHNENIDFTDIEINDFLIPF